MKNLLALVAIVLSVLVIYTVHQDRVRKASDEAADKAAAQAEADARARSLALRGKKPAPEADRPTAVGVSRLIEPALLNLFSPLDEQYPADLVPPLQIFKERILDKRLHAIAAKQSVYDHAIRTLDLMIATAEERTGVLDAVLRINARPAAALDASNSGTNSKTFFLQTTVKRWDAAKAQRRASIDQSLTQLRAAEREWNKFAGEKASMENYDTADLPPVYVKVDAAEAASNPLERGAYGRRTSYSWRRSYYNQYNQGSTLNY